VPGHGPTTASAGATATGNASAGGPSTANATSWPTGAANPVAVAGQAGPVAPASGVAGAGTAPSAAGTPAEQLVRVLTPLTTGPDGQQQVSLSLQPEGLGIVKATVTVTGSHVSVQLSADNPATRDLLRQSLSELRSQLSGNGSSSSSVELSDGRGQHHGGDGTPTRRAGHHRQAADEAVTASVSSLPAASDRLVDVRL
jgi:flagellar hook-length control protein FliK